MCRTKAIIKIIRTYVPVRVRREQSVKRENTNEMQQFRCLLSTTVSTCFGHHYARHQENKDRVLLRIVFCAGSVGCGWLQLWGVALSGARTGKITVRLVASPDLQLLASTLLRSSNCSPSL